MNRQRSRPRGRLSRSVETQVAAVLAVLAVAVAAGGCKKPVPQTPVAAASDVMVTTPRPARVPEYLEVTGQIDAELVVYIRSRITGYLTKVAFRDGQFVTRGDPLYEIDDRPSKAHLAEAAGTIERLLGEQRFLKVQVERYEKLVAKGAAAQQDFDSYTAKLAENAGALAAAQAQHEAARLQERLESWAARFPRIGQTRGLAPMRAIELVADRATKAPDKAAAQAVVRYAYEHGVILMACGTHGNVLRFPIPLTLTDDQADEGLAVIEAALGSLG